MKFKRIKLFTLSAVTLMAFALSGCGADGKNGAASQNNLTGEPLVRTPHDITTHVTNPVTVVSHTVDPADGTNYIHNWTQVSGVPVTITNGTTPNAIVTPSITGTAVLQHAVTNAATGATTVSTHAVAVVAPPASMQVHVSYATTVPSGYPSSIQASVAGGTGPYSYSWVQTTGPQIALDTSTHGPQTPVLITPIVSVDTLIEYTLEVTDSTGLSRTKDIRFTILAGKAPTPSTLSTPTVVVAPPTTPTPSPTSTPSVSSKLLISLPPILSVQLPKATLSPLVPHEVSTGYVKITNDVPGDTYAWTIQETSGATPPLGKVDVVVNKYDSALSNIHIVLALNAAYTSKTTYTFELLVTNGGTRSGTATFSVRVIPKS